jgi:tRNA-dihydrouridine synthase
MIGRGAIRNPWLFHQIRQQQRGESLMLPTGRQVLAYIRALWESQIDVDRPEKVQCERMKKFLYFVGEGVPGTFWHQLRVTQTAAEFHRVCRESLDHDQPMTLLPVELMAAS